MMSAAVASAWVFLAFLRRFRPEEYRQLQHFDESARTLAMIGSMIAWSPVVVPFLWNNGGMGFVLLAVGVCVFVGWKVIPKE
jgi:hypothetical protein